LIERSDIDADVDVLDRRRCKPIVVHLGHASGMKMAGVG
jgi:hypothetical protein